MSDFSADWAQHYSDAGYVEVDPLVQRCSRSIIPVAWHLKDESPQGHTQRLFVDEAREWGGC